jgi:hypothetical protein
LKGKIRIFLATFGAEEGIISMELVPKTILFSNKQSSRIIFHDQKLHCLFIIQNLEKQF